MGANADFALYRIDRGQGPKPCHSNVARQFDPTPARDQFTSADEEIVLLLSGRGHVQTGDKARQNRNEFGKTESTTIELTIPRPSFQIDTGTWAFIKRYEDLEGGEIVAIDRHNPIVLKLTIDTAAIVPFSPELVEQGPWLRGPEN
jgi:hypothetical protein